VTKGTFIPRFSQAASNRFRFDFRLATQLQSLARYSKRTIELLRALSHYSYQVSDSFNSRFGVLFNFPSLYSYAIGLKVYLRLEIDASRILV
jgi:hypothetical protein